MGVAGVIEERSWSLVEEDIGGAGAPGAKADRIQEEAEPLAAGEPRVDEALRKLGDLAELPTSEHPGVFEQVHGQLVEVLGELRAGGAEDRRTAVDPNAVDPNAVDPNAVDPNAVDPNAVDPRRG
jgi:hypothetical protein